MIKNNDNGVFEDVLFDNQSSDVSTEVLFKPIETETLDFVEPTMPASPAPQPVQNTVEELDVRELEMLEEPLFMDIPTASKEEEAVSTEPLFDHHTDEGTMLETPREEVIEDATMAEESLDFVEPSRPDFVSEEVLFNEEEGSEPNVTDAPSVVSDELSRLAIPAVQKPIYIERNFAQKLLNADYEIIKRYDELKNYILLYKGVKSRVSNDFDSFNMGRTQLFKLGYSTKSLKLFLNLDYDKVETRLKCKDAAHKKAYAEVPVFLRIKSPRAMRNAKYLINQVVEKFGLKENPKAVYVDSVKILREKAKTYDK